MKVAAIITEYNPFHNGHKYQIDKTRELLGADTAIISIMSGNFTQRGELAVADKAIRAKAAVDCGVNLVLELPFPYSMSSAEFFAKSGVHIANSLGIVDYLVFGSESGDVELLSTVAKNMLDKNFTEKIVSKEKSTGNLGYAAMCELAYSELFGGRINGDFFTSNNILAIEYVKALLSTDSSIIPLTIKRVGGGYSSSFTEGTVYQSAGAIRELLFGGSSSALDYVPSEAKKIYREAISNGEMPIAPDKLDTAVISNFRLNAPSAECNFHDAGGGLYNRLYDNSMTETTISSLVSKTQTKKYTTARIRRAIWNSFFSVTSSDVKELPAYTQLLAADTVGRSLLKEIKKTSDFPILTKPASYRDCAPAVTRQKELSNKADSVYCLAQKKPKCGNFALKFSPYVKK